MLPPIAAVGSGCLSCQLLFSSGFFLPVMCDVLTGLVFSTSSTRLANQPGNHHFTHAVHPGCHQVCDVSGFSTPTNGATVCSSFCRANCSCDATATVMLRRGTTAASVVDTSDPIKRLPEVVR